jgi:predicted dienelactone hydrolase
MLDSIRLHALYLWLLSCSLFLGPLVAQPGVYDPLRVAPSAASETADFVVKDAGRNREIPVRVYLPPGVEAAPVVLFSHGLGGSLEGCAYLGRHWSARGYVAVFLQHPGSDESLWRGKPRGTRREAMRRAADLQNFLLRVGDVPAVLDQLEIWNKVDGHSLQGRLDPARIGMAGYSFGALTTQAVTGETFVGKRSYTDPRIRVAIILSPSGPGLGLDPAEAFGTVAIPWMLMTGTEDVVPIGNSDLDSRLSVFPALPPGGKYELVLYGAGHSAFADESFRRRSSEQDPNYHRAILALSTAFLDAWLRQDPEARAWLDGREPSTVLEERDRWQKK